MEFGSGFKGLNYSINVRLKENQEIA